MYMRDTARIVHFVKDPAYKRKWYVHCVGPTRGYAAESDPDWRWRYGNQEYAQQQANQLIKNYNLKAVVKESDENFYVISIVFRTDADEAQFLMLTMSEQITMTWGD